MNPKLLKLKENVLNVFRWGLSVEFLFWVIVLVHRSRTTLSVKLVSLLLSDKDDLEIQVMSFSMGSRRQLYGLLVGVDKAFERALGNLSTEAFFLEAMT